MIRLGQLPDSSLVGRKLEDALLCLEAAPSYLERAGTPETIEDLARTSVSPSSCPARGESRLGCCRWRPGGRLDAAGTGED